MNRLRLYDLRVTTDLPKTIGVCQSDLPTITQYVNMAQRRLLMCKEAGDEGWWGTWAEMAFRVSRTAPYLTLPRSVARLQMTTLCTNPIKLENQFYEYLQYGNGRLPKNYRACEPSVTTGYQRNNVPTFVDLSNTPQMLRLRMANDDDAGKRVLLQGTDSNDEVIYTLDTSQPHTGVFVSLAAPFADAPTNFNSITGVQKDTTLGNVMLYQVDPTSGAEVLLLTMEPSEEVASYRRYYFDALPTSCCPPSSTPSNLNLTAIAKLELIPVRTDTDYCLIQNPDAILEECASIRYSRMDSMEGKQLAMERHRAAIGYLNGELCHYMGKDTPAVSFKPFGSASLDKVAVGNLF